MPKGLEFDHVVVLDGSWDRVSGGEDRDAPRRLYYVAMSRAKKTLALTRMERARNPWQTSLLKSPSVLERDGAGSLSPPAPELSWRYRRLGLADVFLSFAGYRDAEHPIHGAIAALSAGDELQVRPGGDRWELLDGNGTVVGQLARGYDGITGMRCARARVLGIVSWERERSEPEFQRSLKCDNWEVVLPELVFEPNS